MATSPTTIDEYLATMAPDRREAISKVRTVILENLPTGYEEAIQYGMIGYFVPLAVLPKTYNGLPLGYAALANCKGYMSLYLNNVYSDPETERWFRAAYAASGKTLRMGKSCVNFKRLSDLPLDVIGQVIARTPMDEFVTRYQAARGARLIGSGNARARRSTRSRSSG
jgi:hypothetical protein